MNIFAVIQAITMVSKVVSGLGDVLDSATSNDPAEPINPMMPLNFEADRKLKEAKLLLKSASDTLSKD